MNVYLTSTPEFPTDTLNEVALILGKITGELEFILENPMTEQQVQLFNPNLAEIELIEGISFNELFGLCGAYWIYPDKQDGKLSYNKCINLL